MADDEESTELVKPSNSIRQVKIGNREYSVVYSRRCGVCNHPGRYAIEEKILLNFSTPGIVRWVSNQEVRKDDGTLEEWPDLTVMQIRNHRDAGHCSLNAEMMNELARRRAEKEGIDLENHTGQILDQFMVSKLIMAEGMQRMVRGEIKPDVKDTLAAAKLWQELEENNKQTVDAEEYQQLMVVYFRAVQSIVDDEQWRNIMDKIATEPIVQKFRQKRALEG